MADSIHYAKTARPASAYPAIKEGAVFTFGTANRHILFCPASFSPATGFHSYPSITQAVSEDNYPVPGLKTASNALDILLPVSVTLYHELYYLTDNYNTKDTYFMFCFWNSPLLSAHPEQMTTLYWPFESYINTDSLKEIIEAV